MIAVQPAGGSEIAGTCTVVYGFLGQKRAGTRAKQSIGRESRLFSGDEAVLIPDTLPSFSRTWGNLRLKNNSR
jgi:hypothetical protein